METFFDKLKRDFQERFMTFETIRGFILAPFGAWVTYLALFDEAFAFKVLMLGLGIYTFIDGCRKIQVNRVKQTVRHEKLCEGATCSTSTQS